MAENSGIEWCKHTWSPWRGCTKVSDGCKHCYADAQAKRNPKVLGVWGPNGSRTVNADWKTPLRWDWQAAVAGERWRIFPSMCDPFEDWGGEHVLDSQGNVMWERQGNVVRAGQTTAAKVYEERPAKLDDVRRQFFRLIDATPNLDWLLLTKRPENARRMMSAAMGYAEHTDGLTIDLAEHVERCCQNLWIGTSVENQAAADERIPHLLRVPAAVRFLSMEPLLGPVDLERHLGAWLACFNCGEAYGLAEMVPDPEGHPHGADECAKCGSKGNVISLWGRGQLDEFLEGTRYADDDPRDGCEIDWVIVGGESGPKARPCDVAWIRSIRDQCKAAGVACFVKQLGARPECMCSDRHWHRSPEATCNDNSCRRVLLRDNKGGDWSEWPADLKVREFPDVE